MIEQFFNNESIFIFTFDKTIGWKIETNNITMYFPIIFTDNSDTIYFHRLNNVQYSFLKGYPFTQYRCTLSDLYNLEWQTKIKDNSECTYFLIKGHSIIRGEQDEKEFISIFFFIKGHNNNDATLCSNWAFYQNTKYYQIKSCITFGSSESSIYIDKVYPINDLIKEKNKKVYNHTNNDFDIVLE